MMATNNGGTQNSPDYVSLAGLGFEDATEWSGETEKIPVGDYVVEIVDALKTQSKKGNPQLEVQFMVLEGDEKERTTKGWYPLASEKAIGRIKCLLAACGVTVDARVGFAPKALIGAQLQIKVIHDIQEGEPNHLGVKPEPKIFSKVVNERALPAAPKAAPAGRGAPAGRART